MLLVPQLQPMRSCLHPGKSKGSFPLSAHIQPHVTSVVRVDAPVQPGLGCTSVFSAAAGLCCGEPFPCTLCWGPPALSGTTGLCPASRAAGNTLLDDMAPSVCLSAKLLTHLPPHTGQGAVTVQFSPEQHLQAGKQLRGQPRTRANAPHAQRKASPCFPSATTGSLPRAS